MSTIHRTRLIFAICLMLSATASEWGHASTRSGRDQVPGEWQRYTVSGEEFSVLLPVVPSMSTSDMYARRSRRERILGAYSNGVVYAVYTFENKSLSLDDLIGRFANHNEPMEPVTVDSITGKRSRFETDDRMGAVQLFAAGNNLYVFQVSGSKLGNPAAGMTKFFSSMRLGNQPEGNQVAEGAGEQPTSNSETPLINPSIFPGKQVAIKVAVITKPEPRYTEQARKNSITGTVVLRAVFSSAGVVTNIHPVTYLPDGLTERSIEVAKQIRFIPAVKDGRFVSMWIELQYNFNLF
jgi:Gram-negative bacterial TonB protein C-terminal